MKRILSHLAMILVLMLVMTSIVSVASAVQPRGVCSHPTFVQNNTLRVDQASRWNDASGHHWHQYKVYHCTECTYSYEVQTVDLDQAHSIGYTLYADGGHGNASTHRWVCQYNCCEVTFTVVRPCSGPPCPTFME